MRSSPESWLPGFDAAALLGSEPTPQPADEAEAAAFEEILRLLSARAGIAFRGYRKAMLVRRARRRMQLRSMQTFAEYAAYLRDDPGELDALFDDVLIGVTAFFRDPAAWEELQRTVIPALTKARAPELPVRAWVAGCGSGEEAYSLAMLLLEARSTAPEPFTIRIFATDVDNAALTAARAGIYRVTALAEVPRERVARFFVPQGSDSYLVRQELRRCIVFARQNVISDPPFPHLDLITCRNLLMYLEREVQTQVVQSFHYALRPGGYLFLGSSEAIGRRSDLFEPVSRRWRIFRRADGRARLPKRDVTIQVTERAGASRPSR